MLVELLIALGRATAAAATLGVAAFLILQYRHSTLSQLFTAAIGLLSLWAASTVGERILADSPLSPLLTSDGVGFVGFGAGLVAPVFFFVYASYYTGRQQWASAKRLGLLALPAAASLALVLLQLLFEVPENGTVAGILSIGVVITMAYTAILLLLGIYRLWRVSRRYRQVPFGQVGALGAAMVTPYFTAFLSSLSQPVENGTTVDVLPVDVTFVGVLVSALCVVYATQRYTLFTVFPESEYVARDQVLEELDAGVFVLDADQCIIDLNTAATELYSGHSEQVIGEDVYTVFPELPPLPVDSSRRVSLPTPTGRRIVDVETSSVTGGDGPAVGYTLFLRDVTEQRTREQRLGVLTRILRHNLRNSLDSVLAHSERVADHDTRTAIQDQVEALSQTGRKARKAEEVLSAIEDDPEEVDLAAVVRRVAERHREQTAGEIRVTTPESLVVISHRRPLFQLVTELVENAIEHNESTDPEVDVRLATGSDRDTIALTVADDGPGIPSHEVAALRDGTETSLSHGTGVGLWLVHWITTHLGGDVSFDGEETSGCAVHVTLRARIQHREPALSEPKET